MSKDIRTFFGGTNSSSTASGSSKRVPVRSPITKRKATKYRTETIKAVVCENGDENALPAKRPKTAKVQISFVELNSSPENVRRVERNKTTKRRATALYEMDTQKDTVTVTRSSAKVQGLATSKQQSVVKVNEKKWPTKVTTVPSSLEPRPDLRILNKLEQWVDKHRPTELENIIGQHSEQAPAQKLLRWLKNWPRYNLSLTAARKSDVFETSAQENGGAFRAALLSGPPGIGKTITAILVCKALGLRYMELNASVTRNKKVLEQKMAELLHSRLVEEYFDAKPMENKPVIKSNRGSRVTHVLILDEVDSVNGNQDLAGNAELIQFIKKSEIPIICICNDRRSQKMRLLANYCFNLYFIHPCVDQIVTRVMKITTREKLNLSREQLEQIVKVSRQDVRQTIYNLQLLAAGESWEDVLINTFETVRQILSPETNIREKQDLFFTDYGLIPLFIQENYLNLRSATLGNKDQMHAFRNAAESIAVGEIMSRQIRFSQNWSLLSLQGMFSSVFPSLLINGSMTSRVDFPAWLGKESNLSKRRQSLIDLGEHIGVKTSGPFHALSTDYISVIRNAVLQPLIVGDEESVDEALEVFRAYNLRREDLETINELRVWNEENDLLKQVKPKIKIALLRALNRDRHKKHLAKADDIRIKARTTTSKRSAAKVAKNKIKAAATEIGLDANRDETESDDDKDSDKAETPIEIM